jgi:hypothetical protein
MCFLQEIYFNVNDTASEEALYNFIYTGPNKPYQTQQTFVSGPDDLKQPALSSAGLVPRFFCCGAWSEQRRPSTEGACTAAQHLNMNQHS